MGGGAAGGGLSVSAMAHGGPSALATHQAHSQYAHQHSSIPGGTTGTTAAPGTSYAALGADLLDKNQSFLNAKSVRAVSSLPIVAVDLYGDDVDVAYFPPLEENTSTEEEDEMAVMMKQMIKMKKGSLVKQVVAASNGNVILKREDATAYKAVKRFLNKGEGHDGVLTHAMMSDTTEEGTAATTTIVIPRPHLIMGTRNPSNFNAAAKHIYAKYTPPSLVNNKSTTSQSHLIIAEEENEAAAAATNNKPTSFLSIQTIGMNDGTMSMTNNSSIVVPNNDDYDRVAYSVKLYSKKKNMMILPEEVVGLMIAQVKKNVLSQFVKDFPESELAMETKTSNSDDDDDERGRKLHDSPTSICYTRMGHVRFDSGSIN